MPGPERKNTVCVNKMLRLSPESVEDMERIMYFTRIEGKAKYPSMNNFIVVALDNLITKERRVLEQAGVVWDHLKPDFKQSIEEE